MGRPSNPTIGIHYNNKGGKRDKQKHKQYVMQRRDERKAKLVEHFGDKCDDCGQTFPHCCYDFHHVDPSTKFFEIAPRLDGNFNTILEEATKCVMLCSNCHRIRHYKEKRN
tara:strand:- start:51 stop:383 length:333 start_codon:yes stop_codon:yes gene_type:complete